MASKKHYHSQAARDAIAASCGERYADYLENHTWELIGKFPERKEEFLTRSLGASLAGNEGE